VTSALTHGLAIVGDLFVDAGDPIVLPDKLWGQLPPDLRGAPRRPRGDVPFYDGPGFDVAGFRKVLAREGEANGKVIALLNFRTTRPATCRRRRRPRHRGRPRRAGGPRDAVVAVTDDAYFGLFYHLGGRSMTESLFGLLTNAHPNLLAVKLDGATRSSSSGGSAAVSSPSGRAAPKAPTR